MGHGLDAAVMASVAIGAHRNARRENVPLGETYAHMDHAIAQQFGPDHFVTAHLLRLDVNTGRLQWVNAGHLEPLLIRDHRVVGALHGPVTLPVGFGADAPLVQEQGLHPGDRILFFTDGPVEKRPSGGTLDDEKSLISRTEAIGPRTNSVQEMARRLSFSLLHARGGQTNDDATVFIVEWRGGPTDDLER
jgi:serine phosphatase RsbU (regulator of sigma subunit)